MPIPIQRPDFHQGVVQAFGLKGKTPMILDEVQVPIVQTLNLERSPYTIVPKRASGHVSVGVTPIDGERGACRVYPLPGFFAVVNAINIVPQIDQTKLTSVPFRVGFLFGSSDNWIASGYDEQFAFPAVNFNQIPEAGSFNASVQMSGGHFDPGASLASVATFHEMTIGFDQPAAVAEDSPTLSRRVVFDPPLPLYSEPGKQSSIGAYTVFPWVTATFEPIFWSMSVDMDVYPEAI